MMARVQFNTWKCALSNKSRAFSGKLALPDVSLAGQTFAHGQRVSNNRKTSRTKSDIIMIGLFVIYLRVALGFPI